MVYNSRCGAMAATHMYVKCAIILPALLQIVSIIRSSVLQM
jgi:hypothetical protein